MNPFILKVKHLIFLLIHVLVPLLIGISIYFLCRDLEYLWVMNFIPNSFSFPVNPAPDWVVFNLPDGLWLYSCMNLQLLIWNRKINRKNAGWIFGLPVLAIFSEWLQSEHLLSGTGDQNDVWMYLLAALIVLLINLPFQDIKTEFITNISITHKSEFK